MSASDHMFKHVKKSLHLGDYPHMNSCISIVSHWLATCKVLCEVIRCSELYLGVKGIDLPKVSCALLIPDRNVPIFVQSIACRVGLCGNF